MNGEEINGLCRFTELPLIRLPSRYSSRRFPLHALTVLSGHSRETTADYYNDSRAKEISNYAVWQLSLSGRGRIDIKNAGYDLLPSSLMIVSVPGPHVYYLPEDSGHWEFVFLVLIGREAIRITKMIEQNVGNIFSAKRIPQTLDRLYSLLQKLFSGEINDPFLNSSHSYNLCMSFLAEISEKRTIQEPQRFDDLVAFLKKNIHRDISVEEMAAAVNLSRSHFTRSFRDEMGISPRLYLEDMRLRIAMGLLYDKGLSVKETAVQCGICDVNYFCRLFKKRYGISPGKYKEKEFSCST